nr:unnamed protein product [Callosobruchus analis]
MRNRKSYFSINAQCLTDANLKFLDVVARWSGATHDLTIFANSAIRPRFETAQFPGCVIIGRLYFCMYIHPKTRLLEREPHTSFHSFTLYYWKK